MTIAGRKARQVYRGAGEVVVAADTLVFTEERVLGKPEDAQEARAMLETLSGGWHFVTTGVCVLAQGKAALFSEITRVRFDDISARDIESYIATGEPLDKAGAYGIQGWAGRFISRIEGCYYNVMGLPLARLRRVLDRMGLGEGRS